MNLLKYKINKRKGMALGLFTFFLLCFAASETFSQNHIYSQSFVNGQTATAQCVAWNAFRASLTPGQYIAVTIRGTFDMTGITCNDPIIVNALATAIQNSTSYTSPLTNGHVWSLCGTRYSGELWINPPSQCSGSNCPNPGYIMRACITNRNWGGINTATCTSNPNQIMELIFVRPSSPNDVGISSIDSPKDFCPGNYPVTVTLESFATQQITSATINWTLNGVPQTPYNWTGLLDTLNSATRKTSVTLLSSYNFLPNVPYTIVAWTTTANGQPDTVNVNDTTSVTRKSAMSGIMTIGGSSPNYPTFSAAVTDLVANGVCGPVVFKVRSGTYTEQIEIGPIAGTSAVNTVTFESETGNRSSVNLTYSATSSAANHVLRYNGCKYVTFRNMTITPTGASLSRAVEIQGGTEYCTLLDLDLIGRTINSSSTNYAVVYNLNTLDHNNTLRGCNIRNGSYGVYWYGTNSGSLERGTLIQDNTVTDFYYMGMYFYFQDSPVIDGNTVRTSSNYTNYLIGAQYCDNQLRITRNSLTALGGGTTYGMRVYYSDASPGNEGLIANNFITARTGGSRVYGLYPYRSSYQEFMHNTIYTNSTSSSTRSVYAYYGNDYIFKNNIYYNEGNGYAFYTNSTSNIFESDYNVFYSNGTYLGYWGGNRADLAAWKAGSGEDANSISKAVFFADKNNGDLHLTGASEDDPDLNGLLVPEVIDDIDKEPRIIPYRGADEACYITKGSVYYELVDGSGTKVPYANIPGVVGIKYHVGFPVFDATVTITLNLYSIQGNILAFSTSFVANKGFGVPLDGINMVNIPSNIQPGIYRAEVIFNTKNSCGGYRDYVPFELPFMLLPVGSQPCIVWPGDVNNDGVVNYGDRKSLNGYIHDANLSPVWLTGPARYRPDGIANPLSYLKWEAQAAVPWQTPEGCYMDSDGNGMVNSFDYIAMKLNWMRNHIDGVPKQIDTYNPNVFDMTQNYPNPFNPTTQIRYSVPERSQVRIVVTDMLGKEIATLVDATVEAGMRVVTFDAANQPSGAYIAIATMQGLETGTTFTKTIRMNLAK